MKYKFFLLTIVLASGCKMFAPVAEPKIKQAPLSFQGIKDSTSIPIISWKKYYSDTELIQLIDSAVTNNFEAQLALQKMEIARAGVLFTKGKSRPVVLGTASSGQKKFGKYTAEGVGNYDAQFSPNISREQIIPEHLPDYAIEARSSWEIDIWGKLKNGRKATIARFLATEKARHLVLTNMVAEVANAYYELLALDGELHILDQNIDLQERQLVLVKIQKEAGLVTELAVKQFEASLLNSKAIRLGLKQKITEWENKINFLCARYPQPIQRTGTLLEKALPLKLSTGLPSSLLSNRPDVQQAELELQASRADAKAARAAFFPSLNIGASLGLQSFNLAFLTLTPSSTAYNLMGGLTAPLVNRLAIKAEFRAANAYQLQSYVHYQESIVKGFIEVNNQLNSIYTLEQVYILKSQEVGVLSFAIETSNSLFLSGKATYLEIITAQKNVQQAKLDLMNTHKQQFQALVNLYRALGGGWW